MEKLRAKLGVTSNEGWYKISPKDFKQSGGSFLLNYFDSFNLAITSIYPNHQWLLWKFSSVPRLWWTKRVNQKQFLDWLGPQLGYTKKEDWYAITCANIEKHGGRPLLRQYNESASAAVESVYDGEHTWRAWCFNILPHGFWKSMDHQRAYMDWLGQLFGVLPTDHPDHLSSVDKWYNITVDNFYSNRGRTLLELYNNSPSHAIMSIYNDHKWRPWKFHVLPKHFYLTQEHVEELVSMLESKNNITSHADWYRVSHHAVVKVLGSAMLRRSGGLYELLVRIYPHHKWEKERFDTGNKRAMQRLLKDVLSQIFPGTEVCEEYYHPQILSPATHEPSPLDVYIPSLQLAFEYQGGQHYLDSPSYTFASTNFRSSLDLSKRSACKNAAIYLIEVPYWWNRELASLEATISQLRPDLIHPDTTSHSQPIPAFPSSPHSRKRYIGQS